MELVTRPVGRAVGLDVVGYVLKDAGGFFLADGVVEEGPFGVQPEVFGLVAPVQLGGPFLDGGFVFDDDFQFVGGGKVFVQREGRPIWGRG